MPVNTVTLSHQHHAPNPTEDHCKHPPITYTLNFPIKGANEPQTIRPLVRFCPQSKNELNPSQSKLLTTRACECMILRWPPTHTCECMILRWSYAHLWMHDPEVILCTPVNAWSWGDPTHTCECMILRWPYAYLWMYDPEVTLRIPVNVWSWGDPMHTCECMILRWPYADMWMYDPKQTAHNVYLWMNDPKVILCGWQVLLTVNTTALLLMLSTCD